MPVEQVTSLAFAVSPEAVEFFTGHQPTMSNVSRCRNSSWLTICHVSRSRGVLYRTTAYTMSSVSRCRLSLLYGTVCRVSKSRGVLYLTISRVSRYRMSLLHGTSSGLTACHVSKSHGVLYRTPAAASRIPSGSSPAHLSSGFAPPPPPQEEREYIGRGPRFSVELPILLPPPPPPFLSCTCYTERRKRCKLSFKK
jgi:hypothetical protein